MIVAAVKYSRTSKIYYGETMKKLCFALGALLSLTVANSVNAQWWGGNCGCGDWYLGAFGGYNWTAKNGHRNVANPAGSTSGSLLVATISEHRNLHRYKTGFLAGANLGYQWENGFGMELELCYRFNKNKRNDPVHKANHQCSSALINGIYQFNLTFTPVDMFFGGGLGYGITRHYNHSPSDNKRNGFAWQFLGGISYPIFQEVELTATYRYFTESKAKFRNSSADVGFKYYF